MIGVRRQKYLTILSTVLERTNYYKYAKRTRPLLLIPYKLYAIITVIFRLACTVCYITAICIQISMLKLGVSCRWPKFCMEQYRNDTCFINSVCYEITIFRIVYYNNHEMFKSISRIMKKYRNNQKFQNYRSFVETLFGTSFVGNLV